MNEFNFAAGITLYHPTDEQLKNVQRFVSCFDTVYIYDNSGEYSIAEKVKWPSNYIYINEHANKGLSYAFNKISSLCKEDFLCTLDQDSSFTEKNIDRIKEFIKKYNNLDKVGIIAPFVDYGNNKVCSELKEFEEKEWVIASGSFVNQNVVRFNKIKYDESYFIDRFEIDFCKQLRNKGYRVLMYYGSILKQTLGEKSGHNHPNHSVLRHYYIFRNRFYYNNKWKKGINKLFYNTLQTVRHCMLILLYENEKKKKLKILQRAWSDYKLGKMGEWRNIE